MIDQSNDPGGGSKKPPDNIYVDTISLLSPQNDNNCGNNINNSNIVNMDSSDDILEQGQNKNNEQLAQKTRLFNINNRYRELDFGPFCVYVEHETLNLGRLHPMRVGDLLYRIEDFRNEISEVSVVGRNRIKIVLKSRNAANLIISHRVFKDNQLIAYIPQHFTEKRAIIRDVDTFFSEEYLLKNISSDIKVVKVQRMYRNITTEDNKKVRVARQMVIVTFAGLIVPQYVYLNYVRCETEPYVQPVMQCYNCLRFGHTASQCKGKKICQKCAQEHEGNCEQNIKYCIYCKNNDHNSISRACPAFEKQKNIKKAMAQHNLSFKEAEKLVNKPSYSNISQQNKFAPLINSSHEFPPLRSKNLSLSKPEDNTQHKIVRQLSGDPNPIKKRKVNVNNHNQQIIGENRFRFCGPSINNGPYMNNSETDNQINDIKLNLINKVANLINNILLSIPSSSNINLEFDLDRSINKIVEESLLT